MFSVIVMKVKWGKRWKIPYELSSHKHNLESCISKDSKLQSLACNQLQQTQNPNFRNYESLSLPLSPIKFTPLHWEGRNSLQAKPFLCVYLKLSPLLDCSRNSINMPPNMPKTQKAKNFQGLNPKTWNPKTCRRGQTVKWVCKDGPQKYEQDQRNWVYKRELGKIGVKNMSGRWRVGVWDGDQKSATKGALLRFQVNHKVWREANRCWPNFPLAFVY